MTLALTAQQRNRTSQSVVRVECLLGTALHLSRFFQVFYRPNVSLIVSRPVVVLHVLWPLRTRPHLFAPTTETSYLGLFIKPFTCSPRSNLLTPWLPHRVYFSSIQILASFCSSTERRFKLYSTYAVQ